MARVVIGLGSNVGDRLENLRAAVLRIERVTPIAARSSVHETVPMGGPPQGEFLNAAVLANWSGDPHALLDELQRIEAELGRVRDVRWGPRTIDLDVLWIESVRLATPRLEVPHPRLHDRAFALLPLLEVAPDAIDPRWNEPFSVRVGAAAGVTRILTSDRL
jgi:2-amino-4-hydroxy-6-hydroxymethyldihydropteridine diphosphokinase